MPPGRSVCASGLEGNGIYALNGATRVPGIFGNPVRHFLSPAIRNAAIVACSLDYIYVAFAVKPESLAARVRTDIHNMDGDCTSEWFDEACIAGCLLFLTTT